MVRNVVPDCPPLHHLRINDRRSSVRIKITLHSEANVDSYRTTDEPLVDRNIFHSQMSYCRN